MTEPKFLAVLDTSVLVRAILATNSSSPARHVFEAALLQVFDVMASEQLRVETYDVLSRSSVGSYDSKDVDAVLGPLWSVIRWVDEVRDDSGDIARAVADPRDAYLLRTAGAVYEGAAEWRPNMFLVTENTRHFPLGSAWGDFHYVDCLRFLQRLTHIPRR